MFLHLDGAPTDGLRKDASVAQWQSGFLPSLQMRVRFPSDAPSKGALPTQRKPIRQRRYAVKTTKSFAPMGLKKQQHKVIGWREITPLNRYTPLFTAYCGNQIR